MSTFAVPGKGTYITLASIDKTFECHINESKVVSVTLSTEAAKMGGHDLHVIRFLDCDKKPVLSCLLMWDPSQGPGQYLHGAVEAFTNLRQEVGDELCVSH